MDQHGRTRLNDRWYIGPRCGLVKKKVGTEKYYHINIKNLNEDVKNVVEGLIESNTDLSSACKQKLGVGHIDSNVQIQIPPNFTKLNHTWYLTNKCSLKKNILGLLKHAHYGSLNVNVKNTLKELIKEKSEEEISKLCKLRYGIDLDNDKIELLNKEIVAHQRLIFNTRNILKRCEAETLISSTKKKELDNRLNDLHSDNVKLKNNLNNSIGIYEHLKIRSYFSHLPWRTIRSSAMVSS